MQIQPRNQYSSYDSDRIFRPYPIDVGSGQERLEQMSQFLFVKRFRCGLLDKMSLTLMNVTFTIIFLVPWSAKPWSSGRSHYFSPKVFFYISCVLDKIGFGWV